jgi:hypothetical protein
MLASKQCIGEATEDLGCGFLVLKYNDLHSFRDLRKAVPKRVFNPGVNLFITSSLLALFQCGQWGIDHNKAWMWLVIPVAIPQQANDKCCVQNRPYR